MKTREESELADYVKQSLIDEALTAEVQPVLAENRKAVIDACCFIPIVIAFICGVKYILLPILFV